LVPVSKAAPGFLSKLASLPFSYCLHTCSAIIVLHPAGLLQGLAAACEQVAAVLIQQQQAHVQQEQQQQQLQQRQATQALTQLTSAATTYCLLTLWRCVTFVCQPSTADLLFDMIGGQEWGPSMALACKDEDTVKQLFSVEELRPTVVPACKLYAAAAAALQQQALQQQHSSSNRPQAGSSSSSGFWISIASPAELWKTMSNTANLIETCAGEKYWLGGLSEPQM
jgi:uncharacterized membrane protein YgcG